ncbi:hypothetical protein [Micromonospora sp. NPDC005324]|uniref:hypothetical protein n=1 Tax=Micromonospora sp. NPDC005324 TaxID=3157033 RepID=UPI0033BB15BF
MTPYRIDIAQSSAAGSRSTGSPGCGRSSHYLAMDEPLAHAAYIRAFFGGLR